MKYIVKSLDAPDMIVMIVAIRLCYLPMRASSVVEDVSAWVLCACMQGRGADAAQHFT